MDIIFLNIILSTTYNAYKENIDPAICFVSLGSNTTRYDHFWEYKITSVIGILVKLYVECIGVLYV